MKNIIKYYIIAAILVLIDQATKIAIKKTFYYGEIVPIFGDIIQLTYIENYGMAFGITVGWAKIFLSLLSMIASAGLVYYIYKIRDNIPFLVGLSLTLILAGAFGNGIDRCFYGVIYGTGDLFYGGVVDFILVDIPDVNFLWINYTHFPVFNIADSCVTCGVLLLFIFHKKLPDLSKIFPKLAKNDNSKDT
jgi:signal peptidase II